MLKKMRCRMILLTMTAFFAVMVIIVAAINITNYITVINETNSLLEQILESELSGKPQDPFGEIPFPDFSDTPDQELLFMIRFFVTRYGEDGNLDSVSAEYFASLDESTAAVYAQSAYNSTSFRGNIGSYRYIKERTDDGTVIVFLDTEKEQDFIRNFLKMSLLIALGSLILVFLIVFFVSKRVIRPFARNIEQQKQFITNAGHELKTPLTSISTSLDVIVMEHGEDEWISNVRIQTDRMIQMVGDLVTLSKLDEVAPIPEKETLSLSEIVWEAVEGFQPRAKAQNKDLSADIADDIIFSCDRSSIQKMLEVLLDNAIRYSTDNGEIRISLKKKVSRIELTVINSCHFETPPDTGKLLERFYRPDESRSKDTGGTGIGLAIAEAAAKANGGTISVECRDGESMIIQVVF